MNAVIVSAKRTVIGKKGGILKNIPPEQLASELISHLTKKYIEDPHTITDVILGNVVGPGGNIGRLAALTAGLPLSIPGITVDRQCASGLEAIRLACHLIQGGAGHIYLAGGVESCSLSPFEKRARFSPDSIGDPDMGIGAENVAAKYHISREAQDDFAIRSYEKALHSLATEAFKEEILPLSSIQDRDEGIQPGIDYKRLIKRVRPAFMKEGTVTAGNSCGVNDGAAMTLIMSQKKANELGLQPILRFVDSVAVGIHPNYPGAGPIPAVQELLKRNNLRIDDIDLVECNEAFASQVLASAQALNIPLEKLNVGGGAIALGHPYGASGAILVTRLFYEMQRREANLGIATLGIGGGMGLAVLFQYVGGN